MSLLNNTKWVAIAQFVKIFCQILSLVVLARLIPPNEYGVMAMAGVVVALGFLFRDMGTSAALIQKQEISEDLKNAVFWLNVLTGVILAFFIALVSPFAAQYFNQLSLVPILLLLALTFPITSFASSHLALMERQSQFKKIAYIESCSSLIATILAILAAYNEWGVYSLVVQSLVNALISTLLIWKGSQWVPSIYGYKYLKEIKQIFGFSGNLVAFNFINYFSRNADRYIIGRFMTSAVLGAYDLAYKIMLFPLQTLTFVVSRSMLPVLSQYQDNKKEFNETYLQALSWITFISFPLMTGMMVLRDSFVNLVFGVQWHLVSSILLWLAPTGMLQSMNSTTGAVLTAKGKTNLLFYTGIMSATVYLTCFLISARYDIVKFSEYYFYSNIIAVGLNLYILMKVISLEIRTVFKALFPAISSSIIMSIALYYSLSMFGQSYEGFILMIGIGLSSYLMFYVIMPNNLILPLIKRKGKI